MKPLVIIELNEINFELIKEYLPSSKLPAFNNIINNQYIRTSSENEYHLLEPWIQWVSFHTGLKANDHKVFRLGDITKAENLTQFTENIENNGYLVGSISAMNMNNKLTNPAYFIPDPWTKTSSDGSFWNSKVSNILSNIVNQSYSKRYVINDIFYFFLAMLKFSRITNWLTYIKVFIFSIGNSWRLSLFLDIFLNDLHLNLFKKQKPMCSLLFLNGGAHIQHHYMNNAKGINPKLKNPDWYLKTDLDPFYEMVEIYDNILQDYINRDDIELLILTGLTQSPHKKVNFYWRLNNHETFLQNVNIAYKACNTLMTRDFVIEFDNINDLKNAKNKLSQFYEEKSGQQIFGEIDERNDSLFVSLTYNNDINNLSIITDGTISIKFRQLVSFVAIKNGEHNSRGFAYCSKGFKEFMPENESHISKFRNSVESYFQLTER